MPFKHLMRHLKGQGFAVLRLSGELDYEDRSALRLLLDELTDCECDRIAVDLMRVERFSSVYIGTLIDFGTCLESLGKTLIVVMHHKMAEMCRAAGMDKVVQIVESAGNFNARR